MVTMEWWKTGELEKGGSQHVREEVVQVELWQRQATEQWYYIKRVGLPRVLAQKVLLLIEPTRSCWQALLYVSCCCSDLSPGSRYRSARSKAYLSMFWIMVCDGITRHYKARLITSSTIGLAPRRRSILSLGYLCPSDQYPSQHQFNDDRRSSISPHS